jgi:hypothetical protein
MGGNDLKNLTDLACFFRYIRNKSSFTDIIMQTKVLAIIICLFLYSSPGMAQNFNKDRVPRINNVYVNLGPSFMYADNGGGLRNFNFKIQPAASVSYGRKINSFMEIKGTFGFQMLKSQTSDHFRDSTLLKWDETGQAIEMKGTAYQLDVMPVFYLLPYDIHIQRTDFNIYAGIGIGMMWTGKEEVRFSQMPEVQEKSISIPYVPLRGGLSYRIGPHSDVGLEMTFLATFSDEIDGNVGYNRFNDHLFQGKVVFKRYLSPFPFWKQ